MRDAWFRCPGAAERRVRPRCPCLVTESGQPTPPAATEPGCRDVDGGADAPARVMDRRRGAGEVGIEIPVYGGVAAGTARGHPWVWLQASRVGRACDPQGSNRSPANNASKSELVWSRSSAGPDEVQYAGTVRPTQPWPALPTAALGRTRSAPWRHAAQRGWRTRRRARRARSAGVCRRHQALVASPRGEGEQPPPESVEARGGSRSTRPCAVSVASSRETWALSAPVSWARRTTPRTLPFGRLRRSVCIERSGRAGDVVHPGVDHRLG